MWVRGAETGERVPHNEAGIDALCTRLTALAPDRIVMESPGGREMPLAAALQAAGLPVAVVNPRQAREFGRALGQLAQTDRLDARLLARMAAVLQPPVRPLPDANLRALRAIVVRRRSCARRSPPTGDAMHAAGLGRRHSETRCHRTRSRAQPGCPGGLSALPAVRLGCRHGGLSPAMEADVNTPPSRSRRGRTAVQPLPPAETMHPGPNPPRYPFARPENKPCP